MGMSFGGFGYPSVATVVVAVDGSGDFENIQEAIDNLPSTGGVVYIKEGTYTITSPISVTKERVAVIGAGRGTIIANGSSTANNCFNWSANYGYISQVAIQSATAMMQNKAISYSGTSYFTVRDVWIKQHKYGFYCTTNLNYLLIDGFEVVDGEYLIICNCPTQGKFISISNVQGIAQALDVKLVKCNNSVISSSNIESSFGSDIVCDNCTNLRISDNICTSSSGCGIAILYCNKVTISNNTIPYSILGIQVYNSTNVSVTGNVSINAYTSDIDISNSNNVAILGNVLNSSNNNNIFASNANSYLSIVGNNVSGADTGIQFQSTSYSTITGNVCTSNSTNIEISNAACEYNVIVGNKAATIEDHGTGTLIANNQ